MSSFRLSSSKFKIAYKLINSISIEKFPLFLNRILQKLHLKDVKYFTDDEEEQLKLLFSHAVENAELNLDTELQIILNCISYIYEQAAFTSTGPEALYQLLLESGIDESHGKVFGKLWASEGSDYISKLKAQPLGYPSLIGLDYHLNMVLGQNDLSKLQESTALYELTISKYQNQNIEDSSNPNPTTTCPDNCLVGSTNVNNDSFNQEKLCIEFSHTDLFSFFNQLERIQHQLDNMS